MAQFPKAGHSSFIKNPLYLTDGSLLTVFTSSVKKTFFFFLGKGSGFYLVITSCTLFDGIKKKTGFSY